MNKNKIVVGISGGVDSAVTAMQLMQEGYNVLGVHLKTLKNSQVNRSHLNSIAKSIGITLDIIDVSLDFEKTVLNQFKKDHLAGQTPSPCAGCNPELKWKKLNEYALKNSASKIASGHYIQKIEKDGIIYLKKASDNLKDQSYFLWGLNQDVLYKLYTPLGGMNKSDIKDIALNNGLGFLAEQKESMGLCFAMGRSYKELIQQIIPESRNIPEGDIINSKGEIIGKHSGYIYYTIGQKRGLNLFIDHTANHCVVTIDPKKNLLVVGSDADLWIKKFIIDSCIFTNKEMVLNDQHIEVKVRGVGRNPKGYGHVTQLNDNSYQVELEQPAWAMAPGQPVVFYKNDLLLGGGLMR